MSSLKDQLLAAGLTDKQSHKNARKKKQPKLSKKERGALSESAKSADQARSEKAQRDKELNRQRQTEADKKALSAQIKQLVQRSKIERKDDDVAYSFTYDKKVKKIHVSTEQQIQLSRGQICIVALTSEKFELVPKVIADKISQRDESYVIQNSSSKANQSTEDDPYSEYKIPDDLMW